MDITQLQGPWSELKGWVEQQLPQQAMAGVLGSISYDPGPFGYCEARNRSGRPLYIYRYAPPSSMVLTGLRITTFNGVVQQDARTAQSGQLVLPIGFSSLVLAGSYSYSEPCDSYSIYSENKVVGSDAHTLSGTFTQTVSGSSLDYVVSWSDSSGLTLVAALVEASPQMAVERAGGLADADAWIMQTFGWGRDVAGSTMNIFKSAPFSATLMSELSQRVAAGH